MTTIEVSTSRYERLHGRKPSGWGLWYFRFPDGRTLAHGGPYVRARRAAEAQARDFAAGQPVRLHVCG